MILAPHTDDGELGCGGSIARFLEEGKEVYYVAFSSCRDSVPSGMKDDVLIEELHASMNHFGINSDRTILLDYPVRNFSSYRQSILDDIIVIGNRIQPDLVFMPSIQDVHQDHHTIALEAMRAFKKTSLLGYELPWNNFSFNNQTFIRLHESHIDTKVQAMQCYQSQSKRDYFQKDYVRGVARAHGVQVGVRYAEVFEVIRWIM